MPLSAFENKSIAIMATREEMICMDKHMLRFSGLKNILFISSIKQFNTIFNEHLDDKNSTVLSCLICDLDHQISNNLELLHKIRSNSKLKTLPILALAAKTSLNMATQILGLGFSAFLSRPYTKEHLINSLNWAKNNLTKLNEKHNYLKYLHELNTKKKLFLTHNNNNSKYNQAYKQHDLSDCSLKTANNLLFNEKIIESAKIFFEIIKTKPIDAPEAYLRLAGIEKKLGNHKNEIAFLYLAANGYLQQEDFFHAKRLFLRIQTNNNINNENFNNGNEDDRLISEIQNYSDQKTKQLKILLADALNFATQTSQTNQIKDSNILDNSTINTESSISKLNNTRITDSENLNDRLNTKNNPLFQAGEKLIKEGRYNIASKAYIQGINLIPDLNIYEHIANACELSSDPIKANLEICEYIDKLNPNLGIELRNYLLPDPDFTESDQKIYIKPKKSFETFTGILNIMKHTYKMYKLYKKPEYETGNSDLALN